MNNTCSKYDKNISKGKCNSLTSCGKGGKKAAFTLAEVLITIGIIGVVSALTIPNLITSYQKKRAASGLLEAHSILTQAVKMYTQDSDEEGLIYFDTSLSPEQFAQKYFVPYLKVARICTQMSDGCWKTQDFYGYYDLAGNKIENMTPYSVVLNNGMIVGFAKTPEYNLFTLVVDIDGQGTNNVMGKDVFAFYPFNRDIENTAGATGYEALNSSPIKNGLYPGEYSHAVPHVYYSRADLLAADKVLRPCNKQGQYQSNRVGVGAACAAVIFKDGWKISKDYPW